MDFDEQYRAFPCDVEFPISAIVSGQIDWGLLEAYDNSYAQRKFGKYIRNRHGKFVQQTFIQEFINIMGDQIIVSGTGHTIVTHSTIQNAFNKLKENADLATAEALLRVEAAIDKANSREAAENFESFNEELSKPEPKKSSLRSLWQGTLSALPAIKELPDVVDAIHKVFS